MTSAKKILFLSLLAWLVCTPAFSIFAGDAVAGSSQLKVQAEEKKKEFKRPAYNPVSRWKEDWSGLRAYDLTAFDQVIAIVAG